MNNRDLNELYARSSIIAGVQQLRFFPLVISGGKGCVLTEQGGRKLIDLSSSWTAAGLGYSHPAVASALMRVASNQAGAGVLSAVFDDAVELATQLLDITPGKGERQVYLGHSGTDANNVAIKTALRYTGKSKIVTFAGSYHGGFGVAMNASGVHIDAGNASADGRVKIVQYPDPFRGASLEESVDGIKKALADGDVACVIVEPILSDGGLIVPPDGFLQTLSILCNEAGVLLICDEVKVGLGRTGKMHAFEHEQIIPDLVTFGKTLGGGLPISAIVGPAEVLQGPKASALLTTAGNPFSVAAARAVLTSLKTDGLVEQANLLGEYFREGLRSVLARDERVGDIRGRGLAIGVDLVDADDPKKPAPDFSAKVVYRLWQLGVVCYSVGDSVLEITPPLVITKEEIEQAIGLLVQAINDVKDGKVSDETIEPFQGWA